MTIIKKEKCKNKFDCLVKKAKELENMAIKCIDFIGDVEYEEFIIDSNKYYLTF